MGGERDEFKLPVYQSAELQVGPPFNFDVRMLCLM